MSATGRRLTVVALLLLAGSSGAWLLRGRSPSAQDAGAASASVRTSEERVAMLGRSLEVIEAGLQDEPRDRWDPEYVVEVLGRDPQRLFDWVRASTDWVPYRGVLRGPAGALMDRQGSSLDRALLLATLLEKAGHTVRLAHGELTRDQAIELLPDLVARQAAFAAGTFDSTSVPQVETGAAAFGLDAGAIESTEASLSDGVGRLFTELHARAADQAERLLREVKRPRPDTDWARRHRFAVGALRDHWWVQRSDGSGWHDLDLLAGDSLGRSALTTALTTANIADLPPGEYHQLVVRVVAERWAAGTLSEQRVLEHVLRPFEWLGQPMVLQIWPDAMPQQLQADPDSPHGLRAAALEQDSWNAAMAIGAAVVAQGTIALTSKPAAAGGPMGGLGGGILGAAREMRGESAEATDELSAVWIEYEFRAPGEEPHIVRRAVFDLLGPAARANHSTGTLVMDEQKRLTRGLALMLRSEMLPVTSAVAPEYLAHLTGQNLVANRTALRAIAAGVPALSSMEPDSILGEGPPPLSPLWSLALARLDWSRHGDVQYVDRIGLLTRHRHPGPMRDAITLRGSVDVVTGQFGVSLAAPDAFVVRHAQGVFDTNAEALWWTGEGLNNTGEAFAEPGRWTTLTAPDEDLERLHLPADARSRIAQDLASGLIVVAPTQPIPRGPDQFVGWWRIDPATGATEGIAGNGWGQCGAEYATVESVVIRAMWRGLWEYVLCQGINQAINDFRRTGAELQAKGIWFWWVGPIESASPEDVFWSSNKGCLIGAIQAGFVSTLPFLIARANYTGTRSCLMPKADWLDRFLRDQRGAIRIPPRLARGQLPGLVRAQARGGPVVPAEVARRGGSAPIDPLAETYPGRNPTNQTPSATGRNPGGRAPTAAGRNPGRAPELGKTQDLGKTQLEMQTQPGMQRPTVPPRQPRPEGPYPKSLQEAENNWLRANKEAFPAVHEASEATGEWIRYRNTGPFPEEGILGDPDFNPDHLDKLEATMNEANKASDLAIARVRAAERTYDWAVKAEKIGDIPRYPEAPAAPQSAGCLPNCAAPASGGSPGGALDAGNAGVAASLGGSLPSAP
jgi:hypothetical protein